MRNTRSLFLIRTIQILFFLFIIQTAYGQSIRQKQMEKLAFLVGKWEGVSSTIKKDSIIRQVSAFEEISYKVDQHILTIDLASETLKLHTVIYYDEDDQTYYYNAFYKNGAGRYLAELIDGQLIVSPNETKRFIFHLTEEGNFQEYGEIYQDGKWMRYFEDNFKRVSTE